MNRNGCAALLLAAASFGYFAYYCDNSVFTTDATDYLAAADHGFWANYLDTKSMGLWGAVQTLWRHPELRSRFWDHLDRQMDAGAKRHFHVALGFYPYTILRMWVKSERAQRLLTAAEGGLTAGIVFLGLRLAGVEMLLALLTGALVYPNAFYCDDQQRCLPAQMFSGQCWSRHLVWRDFSKPGN